MKKINYLSSLLLVSIYLFSSCGSSSGASVKVIIDSTRNGSVINPNDVVITETYQSFEEKHFYNYQVLPSTGEVNILVIPILLPAYENIDINNDGVFDNEQVIKDLETAFFAPSEDENLAYESVSSFYNKSSYGKLNIKGQVTPWFDIKDAGYIYSNAAEIDVLDTYEIIEDAVKWAENEQKIDMKQYDNDKDGYIDGVWCIYSCPNYSNGGPHTEGQNYWAYTSWGNIDREVVHPDIEKPIYNLFGWASYDFMYDGLENKIDAHTYIHETGHFLGLKDYYSDFGPYNPIGKADMMDANIIDHNSYSKMLLGWSKPYIVSGKAEINLKDMQNENSFIVIPSDNTTITNNEFDPFSEYLLIELYTPTGLNELDSSIKHSSSPLAPNEKGVRIYHIDNRKFVVDMISPYEVNTTLYDGHELSSTESLILPISNSRNLSVYNYGFGVDQEYNLYDEIRLIEKHNKDTFTFGGKQSSKTLFVENDIFSLDLYGENFFINEDRFNNGDSFTYSIQIGEIN